MDSLEAWIVDQISKDSEHLFGIQSDRHLEVGQSYYLFNVNKSSNVLVKAHKDFSPIPAEKTAMSFSETEVKNAKHNILEEIEKEAIESSTLKGLELMPKNQKVKKGFVYICCVSQPIKGNPDFVMINMKDVFNRKGVCFLSCGHR